MAKAMAVPQLASGSLVSIMIDRQAEPLMFHLVTPAGESDSALPENFRNADIGLNEASRLLAS